MEHYFSGKPVILIVDSNPEVLIVLRRVVEEILESCNQDVYDVVVTGSAYDVFMYLERHHVPLVMTEYRLSGDMNGVQLATQVKAKSPSTKVCMMTAWHTRELEDSVRADGHIDYYYAKRSDLRTIELTLCTALEIQS